MQNNNKQQPKKQPIPRGPSAALQLARYIDPWQGHGTKWPDANAAPSVTLQVITRFVVTPSSGYAFVRIYPGCLVLSSYRAPTIVAGAVTNWMTGTASADYSNIGANFIGYRVVSCGVKGRYAGNDYSNGGMISLRENVVAAHTTTSAPLTPDAFVTTYRQLPYKRDFKWICRRTGVEAEHYNPVSSAVDDNWSALTFCAYGCDATSAQSYEFEMVQNLELLPLSGTTMAQTASPAAPQMLQLTQGLHNAVSRSSPFQ